MRGPTRREARSLAGHRVLVTGAAGAFGRAITAALAVRGARVAGIDRAPADGVIGVDVRDETQVAVGVDATIAELGGCDALINNAGIGEAQDAGASPDDFAVATVETNLLGTWRVTAAAMPFLVASRGRVVNVASGLALVAAPFGAAYCASKRGVTAYSDVLRLEYGMAVGVSTVYPGYVKTPIHDRSESQGLSVGTMAGRQEQVSDAVAAIMTALTATKPPRDVATTRRLGVELALARHFPGLVDRVIIRRLLTGGADTADSALARALRARVEATQSRRASGT